MDNKNNGLSRCALMDLKDEDLDNALSNMPNADKFTRGILRKARSWNCNRSKVKIITIIQTSVFDPNFERIIEQTIVSDNKSTNSIQNRLSEDVKRRSNILNTEAMYSQFWKTIMTDWWWFGSWIISEQEKVRVRTLDACEEYTPFNYRNSITKKLFKLLRQFSFSVEESHEHKTSSCPQLVVYEKTIDFNFCSKCCTHKEFIDTEYNREEYIYNQFIFNTRCRCFIPKFDLCFVDGYPIYYRRDLASHFYRRLEIRELCRKF